MQQKKSEKGDLVKPKNMIENHVIVQDGKRKKKK